MIPLFFFHVFLGTEKKKKSITIPYQNNLNLVANSNFFIDIDKFYKLNQNLNLYSYLLHEFINLNASNFFTNF